MRRERDLLAPDAHIHAVADDSVPRALSHYADRWHADLVVVGSAASAPPGHVEISRRGRQLLYDAPFSVAVATRGLHEQLGPLLTIGVGYDGGPEAEDALTVAAELAEKAHARLLVRRVVEDQVSILTAEQWFSVVDWSRDRVWDGARETALGETEGAVSRLTVPAEVSATVGDPGYELRDMSRAVDLLVVGSRRWGPLARLVSGGVGETLVRDASSSLLIVPRPSAARRRRRRHHARGFAGAPV